MDNNMVVRGNTLFFHGKEYKCAIGRSGAIIDKKEGDGGTPVGCFPIRKVYYRADRVEKPESVFSTVALEKDDGWSDDINDSAYNTHVKLPHPFSHEELCREDNLYDIIVTIGHNDDPPVKGMGSAIFIHIARPAYSPTAGCVALSEPDLRELLRDASKDTQVCIEKV